MRTWTAGAKGLVILAGGLAWLGRADAVEDPAAAALETLRPEALRADMRFLADDALEGRGTGTRGYELAAKFVASQFEAMGLEPAGDAGTYFQQVPFRASSTDEAKTTLTLARSGAEETLTPRVDYITQGDPARPDTGLDAPVVYLAYGVTAPERGYDDYKGLDVKGKVVAFIFGAPSTFPASLRAHYSSRETKRDNAVAHGAVGILELDDPVLESMYSFATQTRDLAWPELRWLDAQGKPADFHSELLGEAFLSLEGVKRILVGSGHTAEEIYAAASAGKPKRFPLPARVRLRLFSNLREVQSPNVVGKLEGSDPVLRNEYVVYTAHLDHLGIGQAVKGDPIYNGALDNGSGTACLIEIARAFSRMAERPKRSILFVSVTGEEAGLRGSDYFARNPTVPRKALVANVNMDEDLMFWPLKDLVVFGAEHSSLGKVAEEAAGRLGLTLSPDPQPEQVFFVRSDQYSFVKQGIPAIAADAGVQTTDAKLNPKEIEEQWEKTVYHTPQDDMSQAFDFAAGVQYARFHFLAGYLIAQDPSRPRWNEGDFFGDRYGKAQ